MAATDTAFAGSIPELYERCLVPMIFAPYAADLARRVAAGKPQTVLETATGTGVVTRALAQALPPGTRIVATDLNEPMLRQAAALQPAGAPVEWKQADALALPFGDASFDAVACQFGAMFFPDRVRGYREARRVLRPGGAFYFSVWDEIATNEFADEVTRALASFFPADPPRFLARTPHGYHDAARIRSDVVAAGFADVSIDMVENVSRAASPFEPAFAYCQGTPLRNEIEERDASRLDAATDHARDFLARRFGSGAIAGRISALVVTARG